MMTMMIVLFCVMTIFLVAMGVLATCDMIEGITKYYVKGRCAEIEREADEKYKWSANDPVCGTCSLKDSTCDAPGHASSPACQHWQNKFELRSCNNCAWLCNEFVKRDGPCSEWISHDDYMKKYYNKR